MADESQSRLNAKAEEVVRSFGAGIERALADLNMARLFGQGKVTPAEIQAHHVRWTLEWKREPITYRLHVVVRLVDDGRMTQAAQTMVQCEARTPYSFEGHTPTTTMRLIIGVDLEKIKEAVLIVMPR